MKKGKLLILPHMGLGDTIITCGMVRYFASMRERVIYVCKERYAKATTQLFADLPNVDLLVVKDDPDISPAFGADGMVLALYEAEGYTILRLGLHSENRHSWDNRKAIFSHQFYLDVQLPPSLSHTMFSFPRNVQAEEALYKRVVRAHGTKYVVLHEDVSRNLVVDRALLPSNISVYNVHDRDIRSDNLLDYALVLQNAHALHFIDSCFGLLADRLPTLAGPMICHAYARDVGTQPGLYARPVTLWYKQPQGYHVKMS